MGRECRADESQHGLRDRRHVRAPCNCNRNSCCQYVITLCNNITIALTKTELPSSRGPGVSTSPSPSCLIVCVIVCAADKWCLNKNYQFRKLSKQNKIVNIISECLWCPFSVICKQQPKKKKTHNKTFLSRKPCHQG